MKQEIVWVLLFFPSVGLGGNVGIFSGQAADLTPGPDTSIGQLYRSFSSASAITISATLREQNGFRGIGGRYTSRLLIRSDGSANNGYGIQVSQSDSSSGQGALDVWDSERLISRVFLPFRLGSELKVNFTVNPDGGIVGSLSDQSHYMPYSFGAHVIQSHGSNFGWFTSDSESYGVGTFIPARLDDLTLYSQTLGQFTDNFNRPDSSAPGGGWSTAVPEPTPFCLFLLAGWLTVTKLKISSAGS